MMIAAHPTPTMVANRVAILDAVVKLRRWRYVRRKPFAKPDIAALSPRRKEVLDLLQADSHRQFTDIARALGISPTRVRQIVIKLANLGHFKNIGHLDRYREVTHREQQIIDEFVQRTSERDRLTI